jgi:O-acetyl-ADP-ribose deacetylase
VIHAVGPVGEDPKALSSAYTSALDVADKAGLESIAFPAISTGIYGYSIHLATPVALRAVKNWLVAHEASSVRTVVFCVFGEEDLLWYEPEMAKAFPPAKTIE